MTRDRIIKMQSRVGTKPDGVWGPKSIEACRAHLKSLMPNPHPFPGTSQAELTSFYGEAGNVKLATIDVPYTMWLYTRNSTQVKKIGVHEKLANSLYSILVDVSKAFPKKSDLEDTGMDLYFGCYNNRPMRNGSLPSLHARAAAVDFDAVRNGLNAKWPDQAHMPIEVMEIFAKHGWLPAGAFWNRDAMHFQATK
jgi:hypothetical protein